MSDPVVSVAEAKAHMHVDCDEDDAVIAQMIDTASEACRAYLSLDEAQAEPDALVSAVLAHVSTMYQDRDAAGVPEEAIALLREHREWAFG